jgi:hypothetical protein
MKSKLTLLLSAYSRLLLLSYLIPTLSRCSATRRGQHCQVSADSTVNLYTPPGSAQTLALDYPGSSFWRSPRVSITIPWACPGPPFGRSPGAALNGTITWACPGPPFWRSPSAARNVVRPSNSWFSSPVAFGPTATLLVSVLYLHTFNMSLTCPFSTRSRISLYSPSCLVVFPCDNQVFVFLPIRVRGRVLQPWVVFRSVAFPTYPIFGEDLSVYFHNILLYIITVSAVGKLSPPVRDSTLSGQLSHHVRGSTL